MPFFQESLGLPEATFGLLRDLIHERAGLYFEEGKRDTLAEKLTPLVLERGLGSFLDYYYLLKYEPAAGEWAELLDALTVQETYFWREVDQVRTLVEVLVPRYLSEGRPLPLRIWSGACATGEEPLTIAMALEEAGWLGRIPVVIQASDVSQRAIDAARAGLYRGRAFRNLAPDRQARYFQETEGGWRIRPDLLARIEYRRANLLAPGEVGLLATAPFVFCRNVFIYFSATAIQKTVGLFARQIPAPGYLFVAAAESLVRITADFELEEIGGAFVYVKRGGGGPRA